MGAQPCRGKHGENFRGPIVSVPEHPLLINCLGDDMVAVLHRVERLARCGVLILVGGPQYRIGSHRQFLLLARELAAAGIPAMRFDARGMGDSAGELSGFEAVAPDIAAAVDAFVAECPGLESIVLWGLCAGASAGILYAPSDKRISSLVLVNPWVRTETGLARAHLKHYYLKRVFSGEFWRKVFSGRFRAVMSLASLWRNFASALGSGPAPATDVDKAQSLSGSDSLPDRMADQFGRFRGPVLFIMSGDDLTAAEFEGVAKGSRRWRALLGRPNVTTNRIDDADHTFSSTTSHHDMVGYTLRWLAEQKLERFPR